MWKPRSAQCSGTQQFRLFLYSWPYRNTDIPGCSAGATGLCQCYRKLGEGWYGSSLPSFCSWVRMPRMATDYQNYRGGWWTELCVYVARIVADPGFLDGGAQLKTLMCRRQPHVPQACPARGCLGHAPPRKSRNLRCFLLHFRAFEDAICSNMSSHFETVMMYFPWCTLVRRSEIMVKLLAMPEYWTFQHWTLHLCGMGYS